MWGQILKIISALPVVAELVNKIIAAYNKYQDDKLLAHYATKKALREKLLERLKKATTDDEKKFILDQLNLLESSY